MGNYIFILDVFGAGNAEATRDEKKKVQWMQREGEDMNVCIRA